MVKGAGSRWPRIRFPYMPQPLPSIPPSRVWEWLGGSLCRSSGWLELRTRGCWLLPRCRWPGSGRPPAYAAAQRVQWTSSADRAD